MSTTISGTNGVTFPDSTSMQTGQQACKAWVNFNGTGTVAIRGEYNVSSITDNGTGDYTVNFTTAMADANYGTLVTSGMTAAAVVPIIGSISIVAANTTSRRFSIHSGGSGAFLDMAEVNFAIFSN